MMWRGDKAQRRDEALLVAFAERLCADAAALEPRPEFRASLRSTLVAETPTLTPSTTARVPKPARRLRTGRRRMAIVTGLVAATLGLSGMVTASANALPGETLYPVKRTAERAELTFHRSPADRGVFHLQLADRRLDEATRLFDRGSAYADLGVAALEEFDHEAAAGTDALIEAYQNDDSRESIVILNQFSAKALRQLNAVESKLVDVTLPQVVQARERLASIAAITARLCPDCGGHTLAQPRGTSRPSAQPQRPSTSTRPPAAAARAGSTTSTNRTSTPRRSSTGSSEESATSDERDTDTVIPLSPVPGPVLPSDVPEPPVDLPDTPADNLMVDLFDEVDDAVDIPQLDGGVDLLNPDDDH